MSSVACLHLRGGVRPRPAAFRERVVRSIAVKAARDSDSRWAKRIGAGGGGGHGHGALNGDNTIDTVKLLTFLVRTRLYTLWES